MIRSEPSALLLSAVMALVVGSVAMVATLVSNSQAILLDSLFNLVYFIVALATIKVSRLASSPDTDNFPFGYSYFESLVNAGKGLLILGVAIFALFDASIALMTGGRNIVAGLAITYALFATLACSLTAWLLWYSLKFQDSPLVRADLANWIVNSAISIAVLLAFCLIPLFQHLNWHTPIPYVDSLLVLIVVLLCLSVPVRMASQAIQELLNRTPPEALVGPIRTVIHSTLAELPTRKIHIRMVRPGRLLYVIVHVVLPEDYPANRLSDFDALREKIDTHVRRHYSPLVCEIIFTTNPRWAEPSTGVLPTAGS